MIQAIITKNILHTRYKNKITSQTMTDITFTFVLGRVLEVAAILIATYISIVSILPYVEKLLADITKSKSLAATFTKLLAFIFILTAVEKTIIALSIGVFLSQWLAILNPALAVFADLKSALVDIYTKVGVWIILAAGISVALSNFIKIDIKKK